MSPGAIAVIPRPRLLNRFAGASLVMIRAPAGYGKSRLLDLWHADLRRQGVPALRIALDADIARDDDLDRRLARLGAGADTWVLLDNADHLRAAPRSLRLLEALINEEDAKRWAIASRGSIGLPLARRRAYGELVELERADLAFDDAEAEQFRVSNAAGSLAGAGANMAAVLDGWPCGHALHCRAMGAPSHDRVLSGAWKAVRDYYQEEAIAALSQEMRDFLTQASILEQLGGDICDRLLDRTGSAQMLAQAHDAGLDIVPEDPEYSSFRLHPLFSQVLMAGLPVDQQDRLRSRAIGLLEAAGDLLGACRQALSRGDHRLAATLLEKQYRRDFATKSEANLMTLASSIQPAEREGHPYILLAMAQTAILSFQLQRAREFLSSARKAVEEQAPMLERDDPESLKLLQLLVVQREMMLALGRSDMEDAQKLCDQLLRNIDHIPPKQRVIVLTSLLQAHLELYNFREVERIYVQASHEANLLESWVSATPLETFRARSLFYTGRAAEAIEILETRLRRLERELGEGTAFAAIAAIVLAEMKLEQGEAAEAARLVDGYLDAAEEFGFVSIIISGRVTKARTLIAAGRLDDGLNVLERPPLRSSELYERVRNALDVERVRWLWTLGRDEQARGLSKLIGLSLSIAPKPGRSAATRNESVALAWIEFACSHNHVDEALQVARAWLRFVEGVGATRSIVQWNIVIASLLTLLGDQRQAQRSIRAALMLATPTHYTRMFQTRLVLIEDSLRACCQADDNEPLAQLAMSLIGEKAAPLVMTDEGDDAPIMMGALKAKEREVLRELARGLSNRQIGDKLGMTEGTVKWYLQGVYGKLGIRRRSQAALQAVRLGLAD
jgi:LuxR family maltose regulon positive regulatory protein